MYPMVFLEHMKKNQKLCADLHSKMSVVNRNMQSGQEMQKYGPDRLLIHLAKSLQCLAVTKNL